MENLEIKFANGDSLKLERGTNLKEVRNGIMNADKKFVTIENGDGSEHTINVDTVVAMILS